MFLLLTSCCFFLVGVSLGCVPVNPIKIPPDAETAHALQAGDEHIVQSVARMQQVIELSRTIRERHAKPLKMPLRSLTVVAADAGFLADLGGELKHYVLEEVRVMP